MKIFRTITIIFSQLIIFLVLGAKFDFILGFNRTDAGLMTLLFFLVLSPIITLVWFIVETVYSIRLAKRENSVISFLLPGAAFFFFIETLAIDIFIISTFKM